MFKVMGGVRGVSYVQGDGKGVGGSSSKSLLYATFRHKRSYK